MSQFITSVLYFARERFRLFENLLFEINDCGFLVRHISFLLKALCYKCRIYVMQNLISRVNCIVLIHIVFYCIESLTLCGTSLDSFENLMCEMNSYFVKFCCVRDYTIAFVR